MRRVSSISIGIILLFLVFSISSVIFFQPVTASAQPSFCDIVVTKLAEGSGDLEFDFEFIEDGEVTTFGSIPSGGAIGAFFVPGIDITVVEDPPPNWQLAEVVCEDLDGISITEIENGIVASCDVLGSAAECTFVNVFVPAAVPTLSEWGMIAAVSGLMLVGVWYAIRKRKVKAV